MVDRFYGPLIGFEMQPGERGDYVLHSDYEALEARCRELEVLYNAGRSAYLAEVQSRYVVEAYAQKLREALERLINACHSGKRVEMGSGGMTLESQIHRTSINGVPAMAVEDAYEALSLTPTSALADNKSEREKFLSGQLAYRVNDEWGGYWQTAVDGKPYNFRQGSAEKTALAAVRDEVREECAKIAEEVATEYTSENSTGYPRLVCRRIAAAIRARKETGDTNADR